MNNILNNYFKPNTHVVASEQKSGKGVIDFWVRNYVDKRLMTKVCVELKAAEGDSWTNLLTQLKNYAEHDKTATTSFLIATKGIEVAFFIYLQDWHSDAQFGLNHEDYNGLLGLYLNEKGVKIVPQKNNFGPQLRIFNLDDDNIIHRYSIHTIFKFMSHCTEPPTVGFEPNLKMISPANPQKLSTSVLGLNLKIDNNGNLIPGNFKHLIDLQKEADESL